MKIAASQEETEKGIKKGLKNLKKNNLLFKILICIT